jgi:hypothetical protein
VLLCPKTAEAILGMPVDGDVARPRTEAAVQTLGTETFPIGDPRASRAYRAGALGEALRLALGRIREAGRGERLPAGRSAGEGGSGPDAANGRAGDGS